MTKLALVFVRAALLLPGAVFAQPGTTVGRLVPVGGSGVTGTVHLKPVPGPGGGTEIGPIRLQRASPQRQR